MISFFCPFRKTRRGGHAIWYFAIACAATVFSTDGACAAEPLDFQVADDDLELVLVDSSPNESFLAVQADTRGRLFVGGREALFVYEPDDRGGYQPRRELHRFPNHTWIYDIAIRGDDVYLLTVSALYVIPGAVTRREGLKPRRLIWGVPLGHVHQCLHGMTLGPEGDIYFAMGDPLWYYGDFNRPDHWGHWTFFSQPAGTRTPYNGVGGVFRCRPDGSGFRIVARGLRNSCGLCFDQHWNLFTNDNDHEQMPAQYVPGRLNHVTPHTYFSWPRGWMLSKTPDRADLLETMFEGMGRAVPVGQAYYHDAHLPEAYRDNLLVARWCIRAVTRYPLEHRGASFKVTERHMLDGENEARPVGVAVGRGGRIFTTIAYMAQNEGSPVYRSELVMITRRGDPATHPFEAYDAVTATPEKLWAELSDISWSRRIQAHEELLRRGGELLGNAVAQLALANDAGPAVEHCIWLAGASGIASAGDVVRTALHSADANRRLQAARVLAEFPALAATREEFVSLLDDADPQVQHAAVLGLFNFDGPVSEAVVKGAARGNDTYLRQAATLLLAEKASCDELRSLCQNQDAATRLAGTLAAGFRLTLPGATDEVPAELPLDKQQSDAAYVIQFDDAKVDLRTLGRVGNYTVADHWRVGRHNREQEALFDLLNDRLADETEPVRLQAAHFLSLLNDPRSEPGVVAVVANTHEQRLLAATFKPLGKIWTIGPFADSDEGFDRVHSVEQGPIDVASTYDEAGKALAWSPLAPTGSHYDLTKAYGPGEHVSYYACARLESSSQQKIQLLVGSDDGIRVWHNGRPIWTNDIVRGALPFQDALFVVLQPGSNDFLFRVVNRTGPSGLYVHFRSLADVVPVLPEKLDVVGLAERLANATGTGGQSVVPGEFLEVDWARAAIEGDPVEGRKLFEAAGCIKCHSLGGDATTIGGPSLADAAKRFTVAYLVESVLLPSKQLSPVFRATQVVMSDGNQYTGLVVGETAEKLELLLTDTKRVTLEKLEIEERSLQDISPMPQGLLKKPDELRDILAFLLKGLP